MEKFILFLVILITSLSNIALAQDKTNYVYGDCLADDLCSELKTDINNEKPYPLIENFFKDNKTLTKQVTVIEYKTNIASTKLNNLTTLQPLFCGMKLVGNLGSVRVLEAQQSTKFWVNMTSNGYITSRMYVSLNKKDIFHLDTSYQGITCLI